MAAPCNDPADVDAELAELDRLAIELAAGGCHARVITRGDCTLLHVTNPRADVLAEQIHATGDLVSARGGVRGAQRARRDGAS